MKNCLKLILISPLLWAMSCSSDDSKPKEVPNAKAIVLKSDFDSKMNTNNLFAINLFKTTVEKSNGNVLVSPLSVNMALSMTWNGADGTTKNEMQQMLGNEGYTPSQINEYSRSLSEALLTVDPTTELLIANSIWTAKDLPLEKSFIEVNQNNYNATVEEVDFSSPATLEKINTWCSEKTKGKIPKALDKVTSDTKFALINALYFKGKWRSKFDAKNTVDALFANADGKRPIVKMMIQESHFGYSDNENWRCLSLPYGNNAFSMVILLPNNEKKMSDLFPTLTADSWSTILDGLNNHKVVVRLPRFKGEYAYNMHEAILPAMGMKQAFDPRKANFSKMCNLAPLYISQVVHKTFVEVNEEGTEAAATTVVTGDVTAAGPESTIDFFVDQPFIYAIRENSTGTILFMGKVDNF
ncbi:serpin family protein [Bacteroides ihuae]|uniref:serpin family protein n=1 Tax=Bacteroides ihuae TaxID=1852362 RepID=UPI0008DA1041|nr:serpin family protein [Bacteroides ihuae]